VRLQQQGNQGIWNKQTTACVEGHPLTHGGCTLHLLTLSLASGNHWKLKMIEVKLLTSLALPAFDQKFI
jgi:hypothetical protein